MHRFTNPARFHRFSQRVQPGLLLATLLSLGIGLWLALLQSPPDYQQGETVRIMYVHVPMAWLAMGGYALPYLAVFMILGGLTITSLRARNKTRRALAECGLGRRR